jgi:hypothetical protein
MQFHVSLPYSWHIHKWKNGYISEGRRLFGHSLTVTVFTNSELSLFEWEVNGCHPFLSEEFQQIVRKTISPVPEEFSQSMETQSFIARGFKILHPMTNSIKFERANNSSETHHVIEIEPRISSRIWTLIFCSHCIFLALAAKKTLTSYNQKLQSRSKLDNFQDAFLPSQWLR